ncbi:MAG: DUF1573 domain-containing protein [Planctomycetes bacterium]|nr:DUF1573 domain-containing protein [Planctomycetota bacterium]
MSATTLPRRAEARPTGAVPFSGQSVFWKLAVALIVAAAGNSAFAQSSDWAEKMFEKTTHDFGVVARGADTRYRFAIKNPYKQTVHISNVRTTCGCSAATPDKTTLVTHETAFVEVTMDTLKFTHRKDSNLIVTFDQPLYAEVKIPITAYIRTDVVLTPGAADFGAVPHGQPATKTIEVAYAGRSDWKIRDVRSKNKHLTARVEEKERSGGRVKYELILTLDESLSPGSLRDQVTIVTDDQNPYVPLLVSARVESEFTITPETVSLGLLTPGREKTFNIVLRGRKPFQIESIECESDREAFKVRLPKETRPVHVLPMSVTPPDEPGEFNEEFIVTIAGREEPLHFKAYGKVAGGESGSERQ